MIEEFDSERNILLPWWWTRRNDTGYQSHSRELLAEEETQHSGRLHQGCSGRALVHSLEEKHAQGWLGRKIAPEDPAPGKLPFSGNCTEHSAFSLVSQAELCYLRLHCFQNTEQKGAFAFTSLLQASSPTVASREARGLAAWAQSHPPERYGAVCVRLLRVLICNFKIQSQIRSLLFKNFFQYCFPHLPLISETLLLSNFSCTLSSIFITRFSFLLLCFSMTEEILSLAGRIAHSENCRWRGVSYRKIHSSVSHPTVS